MPNPNLVLIGPPKSGTTSVFNWLAEHPEVCTSSVKETYHFFQRNEEVNGVRKFTKKEIAEYQTYFDHCTNDKTCVVEATPEYVYSQSAIEAFKMLDTPIKFLFIHREPASRLFSEYQFHRFKTKRFKGAFEDYTGHKDGRFEGEKVKMGYYSLYLKKWIAAFGRLNVLEMEFEDLKKNPIAFMKKLGSEIGIDPIPFENIDLHQKNKTVKLRNRKLHTTLLGIASRIPKPITEALRPVYYSINSTAVPKKTEKEERLISALKEHYLSQKEG